ncbi:predicted protein [Chaetomium globosum CBS 148.51]|uniref:GET complex subunit GET2 n=1 Tax=Chaetomium globosum (strain ATCC 6205 / CBS 148.51 / DSM 1962 / NBRC 6347 / NRRL 1970) TaxID=306901 RepID=Q2GVT9_CHAGB|nr:uncharacterized protein CHGG_07915 [Chaetomium globosum CBS 148.51]EAQ86662.1 predicted protein [Chaetomium globosum CBS 148.51]
MTELLTSDEEAAAARAAEQARQRKARREAKIKAGAENRLNRITGLGGGVPRDPAPAPAASKTATATTTPSAPVSTAAAQHADPDEVDISEHFYQPQTTARVPPPDSNLSDTQLRQMMLGFDQPGTATPPMPGMPGMPSPPPGMEDDPMMRMMMQMLGGGGNNPFGGGMPGMPFPPSTTPGSGAQPFPPQPQQSATNRHATLWRLLHALIALALGLYIAVYTPFTGSKLSRDSAAAAAAGSAEARADFGASPSQNYFWAFATAEALLLGTRHFVADRGRSRLQAAAAGGSGMLGMAVGFLPAGLRSKVELAMRYGEVLGSVRADVLVCVFVLGVAAWVRG